MLKYILFAALTLLPARAATLTWDRNPETNILGYRVYITSGITTTNVLVFTNEYALLQLTPGATYALSVTAVNTDNIESDQTVPLIYTHLSGPPPVPQFLSNTVERVGSRWNINIVWTPTPASYGASNYFWSIIQGTNTVVSGSTTNTRILASVPIINPTIFTLYTTNALGLSQSYRRIYAQPKPVAGTEIEFGLFPVSAPPPLP